jgi:hypothetical protein
LQFKIIDATTIVAKTINATTTAVGTDTAMIVATARPGIKARMKSVQAIQGHNLRVRI